MIIKIHKREDPYARIDNRALSDKRLSYRARGILVYLLSKPLDWKIRSEDVIANGKEGRNAIRAAFKELATIGYAVLRNTRDGREWSIYEAPEAKDRFPVDGPPPEKANIPKPAHIVTKEKSTNERPQILAGKIPDGGLSEFSLRIMTVMHRKAVTGFSEKEQKAFSKIAKKITDDDLCMVERYYSRQWPPSRDKNILRHDVLTFLNNWHGEVDRALQWCEKHPIKSKSVRFMSTDRQHTEVVTAPPDPEDQAKFVASFEAHFHRLPHGYDRINGEVVYTNGATP